MKIKLKQKDLVTLHDLSRDEILGILEKSEEMKKRNKEGKLLPTRAAVLLFGEEPSGLMGAKGAVRIFHYRGSRVQTDPNTNLLRPPRTVSGPVCRQIQ